MGFHVDSEVGTLRQAILHRPGLELTRLTPQNIGDLLFDDVMWAKRAKEEHDSFAEALRERGVRVHYYGELLAETLAVPEGRAFVLDRTCSPEILGPALTAPVRSLFDDLEPSLLAEYLVGGVLKADLRPSRTSGSLRWEMLAADLSRRRDYPDVGGRLSRQANEGGLREGGGEIVVGIITALPGRRSACRKDGSGWFGRTESSSVPAPAP